jgi:hypothetical protein
VVRPEARASDSAESARVGTDRLVPLLGAETTLPY